MYLTIFTLLPIILQLFPTRPKNTLVAIFAQMGPLIEEATRKNRPPLQGVEEVDRFPNRGEGNKVIKEADLDLCDPLFPVDPLCHASQKR